MVAAFADEDVVVFDAFEGEGKVGEFVVVGGEEGFGFDGGFVVEVFGDGPGDADAVEGAGAAADFVEDDEAAGGGVVEDVGGFLHFDHEGAASAGEVVAGSDAGEDAVDESEVEGAGGDEGADLGHDDDDGDLADVGGFSGHVGSGDDHDLVAGAVEEGVVGDEAFGVGEVFDDGVAAVNNLELVALVDGGADVAVGDGAVGEGGEDVELGEGGGGLLDGFGLGDDFFADVEEEFVFEVDGAFLGAEDFVFVVFEFGGDEALGVDEGLFADVGVGDVVEVGFADFDVVAEDFVVADFEGFDPGAFLFGGLVVGEPLASEGGGLAEFVEFGVVAFADDAAVFDGDGGFVDEGAVDEVDEFGEFMDVGEGLGEEGGEGALEGIFDGGESGEGASGGPEVAGVSGAGVEAGDEAFEVADVAEGFAGGEEAGSVAGEFFDGVEACVDGVEAVEGAEDPVAEEASAHGGAGGVEDGEEGGGDAGEFASGGGGFDEVEVGGGGFVEEHEVVGAFDFEGADVVEGSAELVGDVVEDGAGGADAGGHVGAAESVEGVKVEVAEKLVEGGVVFEGPVLMGGDEGGATGGEEAGEEGVVALGFGDGAFGGFVAGEEVADGVVVAGFFEPEGAGGEVDEGDAVVVAVAENSGEVVVAFGVEDVFFKDGSGGDDAGDFAADDALGLGGIFHLFADGDLDPGADKASEVHFGGVVGDAAHGDALAFGEGDVEDLGGAFGVVEEHFVEVTHAEEEEGVVGQFAADSAELLHHGCGAVSHCPST